MPTQEMAAVYVPCVKRLISTPSPQASPLPGEESSPTLMCVEGLLSVKEAIFPVYEPFHISPGYAAS